MRITLFLLFISTTLFSQLRLDVAGDAKIQGKLNLSSPGNSLFIGTDAGQNDDGSDNLNVFVGKAAGKFNSNGEGNCFFGLDVGYYNTIGNYNCFVGASSGYYNTSGSENSFVGFFAGHNNTVGSKNCFFGRDAGIRNTSGFSNSFFGTSSGYNNTIGIYNVFVGFDAGYYNTIGNYNSFVGTSSGYYNTSGSENSFVGFFAGHKNTAGNYNSLLGFWSGFSNITGNYITGIGYSSNSVGTDYDNSTGLGYDADPDASNVVRIGNEYITSIKAKFDITVDSDIRFKNQITRNNVPGIEFIKKLSPVTYYFDSKKYADWKFAQYGEKDSSMWDTKYDSDKIFTTGFIAQEVEEAANSIGYNFSGVDKPASDKATYGLRYSTFVVPLVKAVQEQQTQIENQDKLIQQQQNEIAQLKKELSRIDELEILINQLLANQETKKGGNHREVILAQRPRLEQNIPNPFDGTTRIDYFIPETHSDNAILVVTGVDGKELQRVKIQGHGEGSVSLKMDRLSKGTYQYSLLVDGKIVDTKRMVYIE